MKSTASTTGGNFDEFKIGRAFEAEARLNNI
jgi:hypothetical protein